MRKKYRYSPILLIHVINHMLQKSKISMRFRCKLTRTGISRIIFKRLISRPFQRIRWITYLNRHFNIAIFIIFKSVSFVDIKFLIHDAELRQVCAQLPAQIKISEDFISDDLLKCREYWYEDSQYSQEIARLIFEAALLALLQKQQQLWDAVKSPRIKMPLKKNMEDIHGIAADIVHYIDNHYAEEFALENLAEALRYNKTYLCKLFKDATGMTIIDYLKYVRISRAYDLLCYTRNSMSCISQIVGFSSPHYFTRVFKKVCKMTPREVRELQRDSIQRDIRLHGNFNYRYYVDPKDMGAPKTPPEESVPETSGEDV